VERDLLVAWAEVPGDWNKRGQQTVTWELPSDLHVEGVVSHLGRSLGSQVPAKLTSAAVFLLLPVGETDRLELKKNSPGEWSPGSPSAVVLQLRASDTNRIKRVVGWTQEHERTLQPGERLNMEVCVYNFGNQGTVGELRLVSVPEGWEASPNRFDVGLASGERKRLPITVHRPEHDKGGDDCWLEWEFLPESGPGQEREKAVLAARFIDPSSED
jgi:hypothetical protein